MPPTRAKSPKLGRRKSYSDAVNGGDADKTQASLCGQLSRQSLGNPKEFNGKLARGAKKGADTAKEEKLTKEVKENPKSTAQEVNEESSAFSKNNSEASAGIAVQ